MMHFLSELNNPFVTGIMTMLSETRLMENLF